jgi:hypothetical protein
LQTLPKCAADALKNETFTKKTRRKHHAFCAFFM